MKLCPLPCHVLVFRQPEYVLNNFYINIFSIRLFQPFYFPEKAGFSVGGPDDPTFYIMETHFDNPDRKTGKLLKLNSASSAKSVLLFPLTHLYKPGVLFVGHRQTV